MSVSKTWEKWAGERFEQLSRSDLFLAQVTRGMEGSFAFKRLFDRMAEQWLKTMRLPTASDLDAVHKRLDGIERRLDALDERLGVPAPSPDAEA